MLKQGSKHRLRWWALFLGVSCHATFAWAVWAMFWGIEEGFRSGGDGSLSTIDLLRNLVLLIQFPLLHSLMLTKRGRKLLERVSVDKRLVTTTFALVSSVQLGVLFQFWHPSGVIFYTLPSTPKVIFDCLYLSAWIFLARTMFDAGLSYQTGALGWMAVVRGREPIYPGMPTRGTFRFSRQPIYLAFFLILWTSPSGSFDRIILALLWSAYLLLAPRFKEQRFEKFFGDAFRGYRERTPYFFPRIFRASRRR